MTAGRVSESIYPYALAAVACAAYYWGYIPKPHHAEGLLGAVAGVTGVFVGFALSALALLLGLGDHQRIGQLRKAGAAKTLVRYMFEGTCAALAALAISAGLLAAELPLAHRGSAATWLGLVTLSVTTLFRVVHLLFKTLHVD